MENSEPSLSGQFAAKIAQAEQTLRAVPENAPAKDGAWSRNQELGHLLDSAQNNHQRIVLAVLNGGYEGPTYAQNGWVDLHGYDEFSWEELLTHWSARNQFLGRVIARIPEERLGVTVVVGSDPPMTLRAWVLDYLQHLEHHVEHIASNI